MISGDLFFFSPSVSSQVFRRRRAAVAFARSLHAEEAHALRSSARTLYRLQRSDSPLFFIFFLIPSLKLFLESTSLWVQKKGKDLHSTLMLIAVNRICRESSEPGSGPKEGGRQIRSNNLCPILFPTLWSADTLPGTYCIRTWPRIDAEVCSDPKTDLPERFAPSPVPRT